MAQSVNVSSTGVITNSSGAKTGDPSTGNCCCCKCADCTGSIPQNILLTISPFFSYACLANPPALGGSWIQLTGPSLTTVCVPCVSGSNCQWNLDVACTVQFFSDDACSVPVSVQSGVTYNISRSAGAYVVAIKVFGSTQFLQTATPGDCTAPFTVTGIVNSTELTTTVSCTPGGC